MVRYYNYKGSPVKFSGTQAKLDKFVADNEHLVGYESTKAVYDGQVKEAALAAKRDKRRREYKNGDYVDAIMKWLNSRRLSGEDVPQELDDALGHWLSVKAANPLD